MEYLQDAFSGIAIYERLKNGNLKGKYTCTDPNYTDKESLMRFFEEKNRKDQDTATSDPIEGEYDCIYNGEVNGENFSFEGKLKINFFNGLYYFRWDAEKGKTGYRVLHEGIGKLDENQKRIAVTYWAVK